jgi:hypothetical protein
MVSSKTLTLLALLGLLHWLFGNLYEAVVFSPNWVVDSATQLDRMHGLFIRTSPTMYFVPVSQLATLVAWAAHLMNREPSPARDFRRASLTLILATALNGFIVAKVVTKLFGADYRSRSDAELHALCVQWNVLNGVRMAFTAAAVFWLFSAFRKLDRASE